MTSMPYCIYIGDLQAGFVFDLKHAGYEQDAHTLQLMANEYLSQILDAATSSDDDTSALLFISTPPAIKCRPVVIFHEIRTRIAKAVPDYDSFRHEIVPHSVLDGGHLIFVLREAPPSARRNACI